MESVIKKKNMFVNNDLHLCQYSNNSINNSRNISWSEEKWLSPMNRDFCLALEYSLTILDLGQAMFV